MTYQDYENAIKTAPTPLYLFDAAALKNRVALLRAALPEGVRLCYAVKANPFLAGELAQEADCFEVCSPGEAEICLKSRLPAEKLVVSGVYKTPSFIGQLATEKPQIGCWTVESPQQYELLRAVAQKEKRTLPVLLRLTAGSQFGLDRTVLTELIAARASCPELELRGIQYFSGTQKTSLKRMKRELESLDELLASLEEEQGYRAAELEFGPGFPVMYFEGGEFDEKAYLAEFSALLTSLHTTSRVTLELGRSIAAGCGTYLTRIVDCKRNKGENYAIADGGIHQLVYYGQSMAMRQPYYELLPCRTEGEEENWNLCGSLCTTNDILMKQLPVRGLQVGDVVAFRNAGAYCITEGIALFLSRELPAVVLKAADGTFRLLRAPFETSALNQREF